MLSLSELPRQKPSFMVLGAPENGDDDVKQLDKQIALPARRRRRGQQRSRHRRTIQTLADRACRRQPRPTDLASTQPSRQSPCSRGMLELLPALSMRSCCWCRPGLCLSSLLGRLRTTAARLSSQMRPGRRDIVNCRLYSHYSPV